MPANQSGATTHAGPAHIQHGRALQTNTACTTILHLGFVSPETFSNERCSCQIRVYKTMRKHLPKKSSWRQLCVGDGEGSWG
ncbi:hypothetical protein DNTS_025924 [Danionella cerebrum]|uniref:Uncharacterized protein n=1 Tax=Danionella cerebrum TaxID=2873325 RepID=A0A553MWZ1_9TELE|nr:hypothetical protein DNTS_025924 [Danionella translucida]